MTIEKVLYLPSGRIFLLRTDSGYLIECTEMRDVAVDGKEHFEVRTSQDPHVIWKHLVPFEDKWLLTVSTQFGCTFNCKFCSVANLLFKGNLTQSEIEEQIEAIIINTPYVNVSRKVKIGFARMGEPACNLKAVLGAIVRLPDISYGLRKAFTWLPCFNTILPAQFAEKTIEEVIRVKEEEYKGFLHFQISCNSTDEQQRKELFGGANVMSIADVVNSINKYSITNRTVTLNFIVMQDVEVSVKKLIDMGLNKDKFTVKLIPLNATDSAVKNSLETYANYNNYEKLQELGQRFNEAGIPTVIDAIARCEEAGLCCGQLAQVFA
jgi:23S rRNA (adenine2503-C2)-methyltransferase